ncbi:MAG: hypothetical protein NTX52_14660, partial [Planctomycetota bacterium]|nr:hypothetical protein [Planctomycetota bacterium]
MNRTCDPLVKSQLRQDDNHSRNNNLMQVEIRDYKPVYKNSPETTKNHITRPGLAKEGIFLHYHSTNP